MMAQYPSGQIASPASQPVGAPPTANCTVGPSSVVEDQLDAVDRELAELHGHIDHLEKRLQQVLGEDGPQTDSAPSTQAPGTCVLSRRLHDVEGGIAAAWRRLSRLAGRLEI